MSRHQTSSAGGLDIKTLVITAAASATSAYVCSRLWAPGTLASAAFTPVVIALLKEAYARPAEVVTRAVPTRGVVRGTTPAGEPERQQAALDAVDERVPAQGEIRGRSRPPRHAWRMAIITGLLGFLVAAVIITVPELVAGSSAGGGGRDTTFFGGKKSSSSGPSSTTTTTTPAHTEPQPGAPTVTVPPVETTTVPPAETVTVPPAQTAPVPPPAQTTPAPPPASGEIVP